MGGREGAGARESRHPSSGAGFASTTTEGILGQEASSSFARAIRRHRDSSSTVRSRSALYPASAFGIDGNEGWAGWAGEGGGAQLRLRALKSVCKRKVTEKGLARHMETVSHTDGQATGK